MNTSAWAARFKRWILAQASLVLGAAVFISVCNVSPADGPAWEAAAASTPANDVQPAPPAAKKGMAGKRSSQGHTVRLNFTSAPWDKVLNRVARQGGLTLVMKDCPPGQFSRSDAKRYTVADAIQILNRDLEQSGYRVVRQHDFLVVLNLDSLRSDYNRPAVFRHPREDDPKAPPQGAAIQQVSAAGQQVSANGTDGAGPAAGKTAAENEPPEEDRPVRLNFYSAAWPKVLQSLCKQAGLVLVAERCPAGTFNHPDFKKYPTSEAIQILNRELNATGFRLVRQKNFLLVVQLDELRSEYERPVLRQTPAEPPADAGSSRGGESTEPRRDSQVVPASAETFTPPFTEPDVAGAAIEQAGHAEIATDRPASAPRKIDPRPAKETESIEAIPLRHQRAQWAAKRLYVALKAQSELVDDGPEGLPSFRVLDGPVHPKGTSPAGGIKRQRARFTVGIDTERNRLVVLAAPRQRAALARIFGQLDGAEEEGSLQLIAADAATCLLAQNLAPQLKQLVVRDSGEQEPPKPAANGPAMNEPKPANQKGTGDASISEIIRNLKGDVTVESIPELGVLVLKGSPGDVEAVTKVIREIQRLSAGTAVQIHVLTLKYVNSESFAELLNAVYKELLTLRTTEKEAKQTVKFFAVGKPNAVLIIAPPADMPSVRKLAEDLDKPVTPDTEFQVIPLKHGYAAQVAKSVTDFYKGPRKGLGTTVVAIADPRTNSIVVQARPRDLEEVAKLIGKLDGPTASQATLKVFPLKNGDALTIQKLLESLFVTPGRTGATTTAAAEENETAPTSLRLSADIRSNIIIAMGPPETLKAVYSVILVLDSADAHQRKTEVIRLRNNGAAQVQTAIDTFMRAQRDAAQIDPELVSTVELLEREVYVVAEPTSNSVLLNATPRYFDELKKIINKLDEPPTQVIIQALIVEVELDNNDEFGIELGFQSPVLFDRSQLSNFQFLNTTQQNVSTTVQNQTILTESAAPGFQFGDPTQGLGSNPAKNQGTVGTQELTSLGVGRVSNVLGAGGLVLSASSESVSFLLRALSQKETIHILSRPQIRTVDNQPATVQVGKNYPVVNGFTVAPTGAIAPIIRYDGAGLILTVQPRITPEGLVVMHAAVEKSVYEANGVPLVTDPASGRTVFSPIKDITRAETTVSLNSGNTIVMGGLITTSDDTKTSKVPWAGDLPVVGQLFRYDAKYCQRKELLIFLTPHVIRNDGDDEMIKQVETERMHFLIDEAESIQGPILSVKPPVPQFEGAPDAMQRPAFDLTPPGRVPSTNVPAAPGMPNVPAPPKPAPPAAGPASFDDDSIPTSTMPAAPDHDVKPLAPAGDPSQPVSENTTSGTGTARLAAEKPANASPTSSKPKSNWLSSWSSAEPPRSP